MRRVSMLFAVIALLAALLAGCGATSQAGQQNPDATNEAQAPGALTPTTEITDPAAQASGETSSVTANTPETGAADAWERHRFFDVWEVGYPNGWTVERPGTGAVVLRGPYGEQQYQVEITRPTDVPTQDLAEWAQADLAAIGQTGAPRQEVSLSSMPALKVSNLKLSDQGEGACPAVRVYARTDKVAGQENYLVLTVAQTGGTVCDTTNIERLADALIADVRS